MPGTKTKGGEQGAEFVAFVNDKETYEMLQRLVLDLMLPHAMIRMGEVDDAVEYLEAAPNSPEQLVVDISGSAMPLTEVNALADACEPSINVVVVGDRNDIGLFRDLMRLGVSDYIAKPITPTLMQRTLSFQGHHAEVVRSSRVGKVVSVVGLRGGLGTTTVAATLSSLLANRIARRAVLIDLNQQTGDLAAMLNLPPSQGLTEAVQNVHRIDPVFMESAFVQHGSRLSVLYSDLGMQDENVATPDAIRELVNVLQQHYHYIIFDVPLIGGPLLWHMIEHSDVNLILSDLTAVSVRSYMKMQKMFNPQATTQRNMLVVNHVRPENFSSITRTEFETTIERRVDYVIPYGGQHMAVAENLGEVHATQSPEVARAMLDIAHDLTGMATRKNKDGWKDILLGGLNRVRTKVSST